MNLETLKSSLRQNDTNRRQLRSHRISNKLLSFIYRNSTRMQNSSTCWYLLPSFIVSEKCRKEGAFPYRHTASRYADRPILPPRPKGKTLAHIGLTCVSLHLHTQGLVMVITNISLRVNKKKTTVKN